MLILTKDTTRVILSGGELLEPEERDAIAERLTDQLGVKCVFIPEEFTVGDFSELCKESREEVNDLRKMLDQEREQRADDCTNQRIKKLESSVRFLFGLFCGHLLGLLLDAILLSEK